MQPRQHKSGEVKMRKGGLIYYGAKHPSNPITAWIVEHLPWNRKSLYVEPFCGMAGVLLSRKPVVNEIINDQNDRLVNWWMQVRDNHIEFGRMLDLTHQRSRTTFEIAKTELDHEDPVRRAVAYTVVVQSSMHHTDTGQGYRRRLQTDSKDISPWGTSAVQFLHDRTKNVLIENIESVDLLNRLQDKEDAVIYCDPPYRTANTTPYVHEPDWTYLSLALLDQKGRVAISGYNNEWDHLGWRCKEIPTKVHLFQHEQGSKTSPRIEKLWMNYDPPQKTLFDT